MKLGDTKWIYKGSCGDIWTCMGITLEHFGVDMPIDVIFKLNQGELLMLDLVEEFLR